MKFNTLIKCGFLLLPFVGKLPRRFEHPFVITYEITGDLKSIVDDNYSETIDSRNLIKVRL